ncbi:hypothetical protein GCM10018793_10320 [Streptomyces sulfonofaciens]|uniref:Uncharacterized protein n=1 Tax=Streptomyces sulfonofaciens TaxID=68272 RepID=A0A919FUN1_9ACTN|nr:hypothetical protein [Streptomyces sulfonofaciens]GHH72770.1 hypothetical protein GCM10018793_10320 [Streptomyces sulfonofaciens]
MRTTQIVVRSGLTAAALALPLTLAAETASAVGVNVSATGSTVRVATSACPHGGNASLLSSGQAIFAQGRQAMLSSGTSQSASWSNVSSGSHTVIVMCSDGTTAGTGTVHVANGATTAPATISPLPTTRPPTTPPVTITPTASPPLGVQGGVGGGSTDYSTLTLAIGSTLVAGAVGGGAWYLRRRRTQRRA